MTQTAVNDRLSDWINPIAIKEMRQAVKGRILTWLLILFLMAQLIIMGGGMLLSEFSTDSFNAGPPLLTALLFSLLVVCLLFLPAIFGMRLSAERTQGRIDLLFVTDMSPYSIIWGKTLAGIVLTSLLFSTSLPFLTLTYLLRGVDLPSIFIMIALNFIVVIVTIQGAIFLACFPGGIISRGIRFLFGLGGAIFVLSMMSSVSFGLLMGGIGSQLATWQFWGPALTVLGMLLLGMGLLYVLSAVAISPPSANRSPVIRLYLLFIWLCASLCSLLWYLNTHEREILLIWFFPMLILFGLTFIVSLSERYDYGPRIRAKIPRSRWLRFPLFFLYSGACGGMFFSLLMMGLTLGVFYLIGAAIPTFDKMLDQQNHMRLITLCLYLICYGLSALWLRRLFLGGDQTNVTTVMISLILITSFSLAPYLFAWIFVYRDIDRIPEYWSLGNPLIVFMEPRILGDALNLTLIWALVVFSLNIPWFAKQIRSFKPLASGEALPADKPAAVEIVIPEEMPAS